MVNTVKNITLLFFFIGILIAQDNSRIDYYSKEIPLYPVPEEMTFEEYQDLNRDIGVAFLKMALMRMNQRLQKNYEDYLQGDG